jgi:hypothetical protein
MLHRSGDVGGKQGRAAVGVESVAVARGMSTIDSMGVQDGNGVEHCSGVKQQEMGPV